MNLGGVNMNNKSIDIIESIVTWQGEGIDTGKRMLLLRFKYCNRVCHFCDTLVKMRVQQEAKCTLESIQEVLDQEKVSVMITGGEPTFIPHLASTVSLLNDLVYPLCNVETNGYALLDLIDSVDSSKNVHYMYSPKIFTEQELEQEIERTKELRSYQQVFMKVVYENRQLIITYLEFLSKLDINQRVWLMPEGDTREKLLKHAPRVFDMCEKYKFNFSTRSHIIYGFV